MKPSHKPLPLLYKTPKESRTRSKTPMGNEFDVMHTISKQEYGMDLEFQIKRLIGENGKLNSLIEQLNEELEKERFVQQTTLLDNDLDEKIQKLTKENDRLNRLLMNSSLSIQGLREQNLSLTQQLTQNYPKEIAENMKYLQEENLRLNTTLLERIKEIEQLKANMNLDEASGQKLEELNSRIRTLEYENSCLKNGTAFNTTQSRTSSPNPELSKLQEKIALLVAENERINHSLLEKSSTLEKMKVNLTKSQKDANFLVKDFEERTNRLAEENKRLNKLAESWKKAAEGFQAKIQELQSNPTELEDQKSKSKLLTQETDRLNQLLKDTSAELDALKRDVGFDRVQLEQQILSMKHENIKLNQLLEDAISNLEKSKNVMSSLENLQIENKDLKEETLRLHEILEEKTSECEEIRSNYLELQHKRGEYERNVQILMKDNEEKTSHVVELEVKLESLQKQLLQESAFFQKSFAEKESQLVQATARCSELEKTIATLNEEHEQIYQLLQSNSNLFKNLMQKDTSNKTENEITNPFTNLRKRPLDLKESVLSILNEFNNLVQDNALKLKELDRYQKETANVLTLSEKVKLLQQENENISKKLTEKQLVQEEKIKVKFMELQEKAERALKLEKKIENIFQEKKELDAAVETQKKENILLIQKINNLEQRARTTQNVIENHKTEATKLHQQLQSSEEEKNQRIKQIQALEVELKQLREENLELKESYEIKLNDLQEIGDRMAALDETARRAIQLEKLNATLKTENEKLSDLVQYHEKEIENLKSNSGLIPQLQNRINQLAAQNASLSKAVSMLENDGERCKELEETVQKLQNKIKMLTEENFNLEKKLANNVEKESNDFKSRLANTGLRKGTHSMTMVQNLAKSTDSLGEVPEDLKEIKTMFEKLQGENIKLKEEIEKKDHQIAELSRSHRSSEELKKSSGEVFTTTVDSSPDKDSQIDQLKKKVSRLEKSNEQILSLDNKIRSLVEEKQQLEEMLKGKERALIKLRNLLKEIEVAIKRGEDLKSKLVSIEQEGRLETTDALLFTNSRIRELDSTQKQLTEENAQLRQLLNQKAKNIP